MKNFQNNKGFIISVMALAAIGLTLSIASHIAALLGIAILDVDAMLPMNAGLIVVLIPLIRIANLMTRAAKNNGSWKLALSGCPSWVGYVLSGLFAYAVLNSAFFPFSHLGKGTIWDTNAIQVVSSVWMLSYGTAFAMFYSAIKTGYLFRSEEISARSH